MVILPEEIEWRVDRDARAQIRVLPPEVHADYRQIKKALLEYVCHYISAHEHCDARTNGVACIGGGDNGAKIMKVRCRLPNRGASRSLRVLMRVYCAAKRIEIASAEYRRDA